MHAAIAAKAFSLLVITLLFTEMLAVMAYAQPAAAEISLAASDSAPAGCTVSDFKDMGQALGVANPAKNFWDALLGWQADQINGKNDAALKAEGEKSPAELNEKITRKQGKQTWTVEEISQMLGKDADAVAKEIGRKKTDTLTADEILAIANAKPAGVLGPLQGMIFGSKEIIAPAKEELLSVRMPNGKTVKLSEVYDMTGQALEGTCGVSNSYIQGKVSYIALLNKDLRVGYTRSQNTTENSQHIAASKIAGSLNWGGNGGSFIVPNQLERFVRIVGAWNSADMWANVLFSLGSASSIYKAKKRVSDIEDQLTIIERNKQHLRPGDSSTIRQSTRQTICPPTVMGGVDCPQWEWGNRLFAADEQYTSNLRDFLKKNKKSDKTVDDLLSKLDIVQGSAIKNVPDPTTIRPLDATTWGPAYEPLFKNIDPTDRVAAWHELMEIRAGRANLIDPSVYVDPVTGVGLAPQEVQQYSSAVRELKGAEKDILEMEKLKTRAKLFSEEESAIKDDLTTWGYAFERAEDAAFRNFALGMAWLGPASFALQISTKAAFFTPDATTGDYKDHYFDVFVREFDLLKDFRDASDMLGIAKIGDLMKEKAGLGVGIPEKTFNIYDVFIANQPRGETEITAVKGGEGSTTSISESSIFTDWKGGSEAAMFEDILSHNYPTTSLGLFTNKLNMGAVLPSHFNLFDSYYTLLFSVAVPTAISWKVLKHASLGAATKMVTWVGVTDFYLDYARPTQFGHPCDPKLIDRDINMFKAAVGADIAANVLMMYAGGVTPGIRMFLEKSSWTATFINNNILGTARRLPWVSRFIPDNSVAIAQKFESLSKTPVGQVTNLFPLTTIAQTMVTSQALQYAMACQDDAYYIMAYQRLPKTASGSLIAKDLGDKLKPVTDKLNDLSISKAVKGVGDNLKQKDMQEILNLRMLLDDQYGMLEPKDVYYLHLSSANQQWFDVFSKKCFRNVLDGKEKAVVSDASGVTVLNKKTGEKTNLADRIRSLLQVMSQELGRTIVPNKIIAADMSGSASDVAFEIKATDAGMKLYAGASGAGACAKSQLAAITGAKETNDLSSITGNVQAVYTKNGRIGYSDGYMRYTYFTGKEGGLLGIGAKDMRGSEAQIPGVDFETADEAKKAIADKEKKASGDILDEQIAGKATVYGDASVKLSGAISKDKDTIEAGELVTVITDNGKIEYDAANKKLYIAITTLAKVPGNAIKSVSASASTAYDNQCAKTAPALRFENLRAEVNSETDVKKLADALEKIQQDYQGGKGGMQVLETAENIYYFTFDKNCQNQLLRVFDKKTGEWTDYKITGAPRKELVKEGDKMVEKIVVPTDKGDFKFNIGSQNGVPTLNITNPDGTEKLLPLLMARGQNGVFAFDPYSKTWYALNGQDMPWNPDFVRKGLAYQGDQYGARGYPAENLLGAPAAAAGGGGGQNSLLALPMSPTDDVALLLFVVAMAGGAMLVYARRREVRRG